MYKAWYKTERLHILLESPTTINNYSIPSGRFSTDNLISVNPLPAKLFNLNFHLLEVVSR